MNSKFTIKTTITTLTFLSVLFAVYYLFLIVSSHTETENSQYLFFTSTYSLIAFVGSIGGVLGIKNWGGHKSVIGKALIYFSIGLLLQFFGQLTYSYYLNILQTEPPYPSVAEFAFVASLLSYLLGSIELSSLVNIKISLRYFGVKIFSTLVGIAAVVFAIFLFYVNHDFESDSSILLLTLEFSYPLIQALYIIISLISIYVIKNLFGGKIIKAVILIFIGIFTQYIADSLFLWFPTILTDGLYLISYISISFGVSLFSLFTIHKNMLNGVETNKDGL